jgi:hypothetical protein
MNRQGAVACLLGTVFFLVLAFVLLQNNVPWFQTLPGGTGIGDAIWRDRTFEIVFQGLIILSGVISILLLLGPDKTRGMPP